jgi:glycosyltransferase involved in cell wall biosynthesis
MTASQGRISVVVPAYNAEHYIEECLDSLIAQSYTDWECLCMNDGSFDQTWPIMQSYAGKDPRIKIFSQENKGVTRTLNTLLEKVTGDYLFYLDSDDFIHPQTFEILLSIAERDHLDVVECEIRRLGPQREHVVWRTYDTATVVAEPVHDLTVYFSRKGKKGKWINKVNKLYRFEKVRGLRFSEKLSYEEDYFYATQLYTVIHSKAVVDLPLYVYRVNPASQTQSVNFERYTAAAIARIGLSHHYFITQQRLPLGCVETFMEDLAQDAYRMIIRKTQKKCTDEHLRRKLFVDASRAMGDYVARGVVELKYLKWAERLAAMCCVKQWYGLTRGLVFLT